MYVKRLGLPSLRISEEKDFAKEIFEKTGIPPEKQYIHTTRRGRVLMTRKEAEDIRAPVEQDESDGEAEKATEMMREYMESGKVNFKLRKERVKEITKALLEEEFK